MKVHIEMGPAKFYFYPDVVVDCVGKGERSVDEPAVIFEILSPETERFDRGEKLLHSGSPRLVERDRVLGDPLQAAGGDHPTFGGERAADHIEISGVGEEARGALIELDLLRAGVDRGFFGVGIAGVGGLDHALSHWKMLRVVSVPTCFGPVTPFTISVGTTSQ